MTNHAKSGTERVLLLHPFLLALYPVLTLYVHNAGELDPVSTLRPTCIILLGVLTLWGLFRIITRNRYKAAMMCSLSILTTFSWGHVAWAVEHIVTLRSLFLFTGYALLAAAISVKIMLSRADLSGVTRFLNYSALLLVLVSLCQGIFSESLFNASTLLRSQDPSPLPTASAMPSDTGYPDIYFIVLDGYARKDVLLALYAFDNTPFLDSLARVGFFVAGKSRSNYSQTQLSLASCLNMSHLSSLTTLIGTQSTDRTPLIDLIRNNKLHRFLRRRGYSVIAFATGYDGTEMRSQADLCLRLPWCHSEFENALLATTPIPQILRYVAGSNYLYDRHRERIQFTFDRLGDLAREDKLNPKFVFAHVLAPHPPFVFDHDGSPTQPNAKFSLDDNTSSRLTPAEYRRGYIAQLRYVNTLVRHAVVRILDESPTPPVIAVVSDHGPASTNGENAKERISNLCLLHLTGGKSHVLYHDITLVNLFRIILNTCFNANLALAEDKSYMSPWLRPYELRLIPSD